MINIDSVSHKRNVVQVHCYTVNLYSAVSLRSFDMCLSQIADRSVSEPTWLLSIHPSGHQSSAGITQKDKQPFTLTFTPTPTLESPVNRTTNMWFGLWEKAKVPRENQFKHRDNMNSTQKSPRPPALKAGSFFFLLWGNRVNHCPTVLHFFQQMWFTFWKTTINRRISLKWEQIKETSGFISPGLILGSIHRSLCQVSRDWKPLFKV